MPVLAGYSPLKNSPRAFADPPPYCSQAWGRYVFEGLDHVGGRGPAGFQHAAHYPVGEFHLPSRILREGWLPVRFFTADETRRPQRIPGDYPRHVCQRPVTVVAGIDGALLPAHGNGADLQQGVGPEQPLHADSRGPDRRPAQELPANGPGLPVLRQRRRVYVVHRLHHVVEGHSRRFQDDAELLVNHPGLVQQVALADDAANGPGHTRWPSALPGTVIPPPSAPRQKV